MLRHVAAAGLADECRGRMTRISGGYRMPAGSGYAVEVTLARGGGYTVRRTRLRRRPGGAPDVSAEGEITVPDAAQMAAAAVRAARHRTYAADEWPAIVPAPGPVLVPAVP